jgi:glycosyltransferase involved in cell wall biosynthesis
MAHIFINGLSAKSGGGKSILTNFLTVLKSQGSCHKFTVLVPDANSYQRFIDANINVISFPFLSKQALLPLTTAFVLPGLVRRLGCDLVFNPADLPIPSDLPQLFLFDWPYAAYPNSIAWNRGSFTDIAKRRLKYCLFRRYLRFIDVIIAQSPALRKRLMHLYGVNDIPIVPNAVSIDNFDLIRRFDFGLGRGFKLLCLSYYYSHKNLEIFIQLAKLIRRNDLDWKIVITIHPDQGTGARRLLNEIDRLELENIICNVGPVPMSNVPSLYRQCDALLLPTLLESFSGTYVEAMFHGKPIFTSKYDFATDICQESAWYFDPLDANDIFKCIHAALDNPDLMEQKIVVSKERLSSMLSWDQAFNAYMTLIDALLDRRHEKPLANF